MSAKTGIKYRNCYDALEKCTNVNLKAKAEGPTAVAYYNANGGWLSPESGYGYRAGSTVGQASTYGYIGGPTPYTDSYDGSKTSWVSDASVGARATVGRAKVNWNVFSAEVQGPHASAKADARYLHIPYTPFPLFDAGAMVEASAGKASVNAGPLFASAGLNANTGARVGTTGFEANLLGLGISVGRKTSINTPIGSVGIDF